MPDLINSFDGGCTTFLDAGQVTDDLENVPIPISLFSTLKNILS
ncbi:hypothetical protein QWY93_19030 [Echinicola jeungdonensis]|nr:hypothetical protein [Echinicola jeungdonensis]MDN3671359.1 hypothetical protein [Echinicola jeungdonensis]